MKMLVALSSLIFATIVLLVQSNVTKVFDKKVIRSLRDKSNLNDPLGPRWFEETAADITALGGYPILTLVAICVVFLLLAQRLYPAALFLVFSLGLGSALSSVLKLVFARPRPNLVEHLDQTFTSSFPSAHAMVSTIVWFTLAAVAIRFIQKRRVRHIVISFAALVVALVGVSRIYLGVHWPTDVMAGWACGLAWSGICWLIANKLQAETEPNTDLGHSSL